MSEPARPRVHPYHLAFGAEAMDDRLFPPIAEEAAARGLPLDDPDRFLFLSSVGRLLRAVAGGGSEPREEEEAGEGLRQYGRMLYHAFHYWRTGKRTVAVDAAALRSLLDPGGAAGGAAGGPAAGWRPRPPAPGGYFELPLNLVWAAPAEAMPPEPVAGFFWSFLEESDPPALHVLLTLGVRPDRAGFSVVPATGWLDDGDQWAGGDARPGGTDFETTLPGGEIDRLYSIETTAEILKLASLCFWHLDRT